MNMTTITGARIRDLREQRNERQDDIANLLGISRAAISRYEKGERKPDYSTIVALARYFNVSTDYLLGASDTPDPDNIFIPANIDLICGSMSYEEMSGDMSVKMASPLYKAIFDTGTLRKLANGKIPANQQIIGLLSEYAEVDSSFFYRNNTVEDLENARKAYVKEGAPAKSSGTFDDELKAFAANADNIKYLRLAMSIKQMGIDPEKVNRLIGSFLKNPDDWKYLELAQDIKNKIVPGRGKIR